MSRWIFVFVVGRRQHRPAARRFSGDRSRRMFNLRGTLRFFAFDPSGPNIIYARVTGLRRSADGGLTWRLIYPQPLAIKSIRMASDHADETLYVTTFGGCVWHGFVNGKTQWVGIATPALDPGIQR